MRPWKFLLASLFLLLLAFGIPIEHKYDKLFRFFSLTLIPDGLEVPKSYDPKIYFYPSDLISIALLGMGLFFFRISWKEFFWEKRARFLWMIFACAALSIAASPYNYYPIPYIRLLQLLTPFLLFSFLQSSFTVEEREKITRYILFALVIGGLFQTGLAISQYFHQGSFGLRLIGEQRMGLNGSASPSFQTVDGSLWLFDAILHPVRDTQTILRTMGTLPHPNVLGGFLVLSILSTYCLAARFDSWKTLFSLTLPFQFFALFTTFSRSAIFGCGIATFVWFAIASKDQPIRNLRVLGGMVVFSALLSFTLLYHPLLHRGGILNYNSCAEGSDRVRLTQQKIAFQIIEKNPFLGVGFTQYSLRSPNYFPSDIDPGTALTGAHNIYLFLASETGLFSLGVFLFFIFSLLRGALRSIATPELASLTSIFVALLFIGGCDFYPLLFQQGKLMFFLIAGLLAIQRQKIDQIEKSESWKMFDLISPTYDRINRLLSLGMDKGWRNRVAQHLPSGENLEIVDLATGTGDQLIALLNSLPKIRSAIGIDLSTEMLSLAEQKFLRTPYRGKVRFLHADAERLPFSDRLFDAATFSFGIRNVTDPTRSLSEIFRVLKPAGRCLILEFSLPPKIIRPFYFLYLRHLLPWIGGVISRKPCAYRYLNQTIEKFPSGKEFCSLMENAGFGDVKKYPMALGAVTLYVGEKK